MRRDIHQQIAGLSDEKRALLARLLKQQGVELGRSVIVPQRRDTGLFPLSFAQQRLWFLDQLDPHSASYNLPAAVRLKGRLDAGALERSLQELIRRHESLRTSFAVKDKEPAQIIAPELNFSLSPTDLQHLPEAEREAEAVRLAGLAARTPFDLSQAPLLRAALIRLAADDHLLVLVMHHIISDGWSMGVFIREVVTLYHTLSQGRAPQLPSLPIQYADYACWQRDWLQGAELDRQLAYWTAKLRDCPAVLELPTDHPRTTAISNRGATFQFSLPLSLKEQLTTLSQAHGATLFMTLLAAFQTLLARYTGQESISVGTPIAGRTRPEVQNVIGFFVNTLVMNTDLSGNPEFIELLSRARETALGAYDHQDLPFEQLVEAIQPERDLAHSPLFQVMFDLTQEQPDTARQTELSVTPVRAETGLAKFDLSLSIIDQAADLIGLFEYNAELFEAATIERMSGHFRTLLAAIADNPQQRLAELPLLTAAEEAQLAAWNATAAPFPADSCVHHLFEAQAARTPHAIALVCGSQHLTYRELDDRSSRLADHLQRLGVGPEVLVALCLTRSPELAVALLGVLKAGGAYLPLDPASPPDRLARLLGDAQPLALLTQSHLTAQLPALPADLHLCCLDTPWELPAGHAPRAATGIVGAENLAYVIFTSGSTGEPKGVQITHRALVNHNTAMIAQLHLSAADRVLQFAALSFDVAAEEIFPAWLAGATVVLRPDGLLSGAELQELIAREQLTVVNLPAPYWHEWVDELAHSREPLPASLRLVVTGSDRVSAARYAEWRALVGTEVGWMNGYGPTEATITCTLYAPGPEWQPGAAVPIGRPLANTRIYILDRQGQPVPVGVAGELCIGGAGLARGYLNRPELTAEKFITWSVVSGQWSVASTTDGGRRTTDHGQCLYRTGDLARFLADGNIEFLGRRDEQVKIRGYRIEPGEIEAALREQAGVREAVVTAREERPGHKRLVAYVVATTERPGVDEWREGLKARLPDYMVPAAFVLLDELPLTSSGKLDRKRLPQPEEAAESGSAAVAPRTLTEELVAGIWAAVLGLKQVGIHDNFFALGGHSLLAMQVMSRVRDVFGVEVPLRVLFEESTVAGLAQRLENQRRQAGDAQRPPLVPVPRNQALPLSFSQQRLWFLHQFEPDSPLYNMPEAVRLSGRLNVAALERSLNEIISRHEILRTTYELTPEQPVQVISPSLTVTLTVTDFSHLPESERTATLPQLINEQAGQPFDLTAGPLLRARLFRLAEDEHVLLFILHHICSDGWSQGILVRELATLYQAFASDSAVSLPPLPVQYADYACWQRNWLQGAELDRQLAYWREKLGGELQALELPTDHPRPAVQTSRGANCFFTLSAELTQQARAFSRTEGVTLFMTLLAAFQLLLQRYTGQESISVGTPIAGRTRSEVENLIGFFVNTLVLRTELSGEPDFRELVRRVRETALGAYAHQDIPFERLVDELQPERDLSRTPLFQVMFMLQNAGTGAIDLPELKLSSLPIDTGASMFDLTLSLSETPDGISGALEYNADLFEAATIERMVGHFELLLTSALADPAQQTSRLPLLTAAEEAQLAAWNATTAPFPADSCVHHLFAAQAARTPHAIALVCGSQHLTYQQLDDRASQLAEHLQRLGVGPEVLVALCLTRSTELAVALLGVLKAGGAYLPLDPASPPERLARLLGDAQPLALLTQSHLTAQLPALPADLHLCCLDTPWELPAGHAPRAATGIVGAENLAYVIFTSGSTGEPKGVQITHRALVNHNTAMIAQLHLSAADRVLQFAALSFDVAAEEIFPAWLAGATVVLRPDGLLSGAELQALIAREQLTVVNLPAPYWHEWVDELAHSREPLPTSLRLVVTGSDRVSAARYAQWRELVGTEVGWMNGYGPTEATITCTLYAPGPEWQPGAAVPIGRPLANTQIYILDRQGQPVPVGVAGELCIGGAGLARGYLNRPELTAEKFITWSVVSGQWSVASTTDDGRRTTDHGQCLYRTGDQARFLADGNIEFLGRRDEQVKIRGYRIEPGEIEAALREQAGVREAVVTAREEAAGHKRLVAYLVGSEGVKLVVSELREGLKARLPDYMVPAAFVLLDELPLTSSGKLDRRALPAPAVEQTAIPGEALPRTATEQKLADIWQQVLGLRQVSINDNFFALGGDSILSIQVIARARAAGLHLTPKQLFESPTISALAAVAAAAPGHEAEQGVIEGETPLAPIQRWFFAQHYPEPWHWNQAVLLALREPLERTVLERALAALLHHHDALRMRYKHGPAGWVQTNEGDSSDEAPLQWFDLSDLTAEEQHTLIESEAQTIQAGLDLNAGLLRAAYFDCGSQPARLLLVIHHLVIDGVSWRVLLEDFQTIYAQLRQAQTPQLPAKTTSFRQWAQRLDDYAQSPEIQQQLNYWLSVTKGAAAHLPADLSGANTEASGRSVLVELSEDETKSLLQEVPQAYGTEINDVLLTALGRVLTQWTGERAVLVDLEGHGREDVLAGVDVSRTVGWFTTVFPARLEASAEWRAGDALKATKEELRRIPQRGIGYGLLRYLSRDESVRLQLAAQPHAEVIFNYLGQFDRGAQNDGLFTAAAESSGAARSLRAQRGHALEVTGVITGGRLQMDFSYSEQLHRRDTIERLAAEFMAALRALIAHCLAPEAGGYTPSDFALARLDQKKLDKVLGKLDRAKNKRNRTSE